MTSPRPSAASADPPPNTAAHRRRRREQEIIDATRALIDERGVSDAQIEDIANAVGINRAIVYRHFTGKEELFCLTLVQYLDELRERMIEADDAGADPTQRLRLIVGGFADYGLEFPAFVDCAQSIMRRQGRDLLEEVSEGALFRLGRAMTGCLRVLTDVIEAGVAQGEFQVDDANLLANMSYASGLGSLQLARVGILVSETAPGVPVMSRITPDQVRDHIVSSVLGNVVRRPSTGN